MTLRDVFKKPASDAILLFALLLTIYLLNGGLIVLADSVSNSYLPVTLLDEGNLSFTADEFPFMFGWQLQTPQGVVDLAINEWTPEALALREQKLLELKRENYFLVPTRRPGIYANTFGPGAGLTALPAVAAAEVIVGDLQNQRWFLAAACRLVASACVAGSAALLYLTARGFVGRLAAVGLAIAYGLGTCVWAVSSQSLTQHGPNELFLALGVLAISRSSRSWWWPAIAGAAFGAAVVCRPTSGIAVIAAGVYLLFVDWRGCLVFAATCCPLLLFLAGYNAYYFDSPWTFGQTIQARLYLEREFGTTNPWRTPLLTGLCGLLFSPSRGVLIFSPWLVLAPCGLVAAWRRPAFRWLWPLAVAASLTALLQCKWFDWWGGWCYGYRPLVDTLPLAVPLVIPLLGAIWSQLWLRTTVAALVAWSVGVQFLGATAFDLEGWNARRGYAIEVAGRKEPEFTTSREAAIALARQTGGQPRPTKLNIDFPPYNSRLWSISDNQISYYLTHFAAARETRRKQSANGGWIAGRTPGLTDYSLGFGFTQLGRIDDAVAAYRRAIEAQPGLAAAHLNLGNIFAAQRNFDSAVQEYLAAIRIDPRAELPRENLARVYTEQGRAAEAAAQLRICLELEGATIETQLLYAENLAALGHDTQAVSAYRDALQAAPQHSEALRGLSWLLATTANTSLQNPREAWELTRIALAANTAADPRLIDAAAAAAAALGRFEQAADMAESAARHPALRGDPGLVEAILSRAELYRQQKAFVRAAANVDTARPVPAE